MQQRLTSNAIRSVDAKSSATARHRLPRRASGRQQRAELRAFIAHLRNMPNVGEDADFARVN